MYNYGYDFSEVMSYDEYGAENGYSSGISLDNGIQVTSGNGNKINVSFNQMYLQANQQYHIYFTFHQSYHNLQLNKLYGSNNIYCNNVSSFSNSLIDLSLGPNSPSVTGGNTFYLNLTMKGNCTTNDILTITVIGVSDIY